MKTLITYLKEELAMPFNTMGMGNPGIETEPLVSKKRKKKKEPSE